MFLKRNKVILHIAYNDTSSVNKFVPNYSKMLEDNLDIHEHDFYYAGSNTGLSGYPVKHVFKYGFMSGFRIAFLMMKYKKIVFHSAPPPKIAFVISIFPSLFFDAYIAIWGGELDREDDYQKKTFKRKVFLFSSRLLIKKCSGVITYLEADYDFAKKNINNKLKLINLGGFYPSNLIDVKSKKKSKSNDCVSILLGASALKRNDHFTLIDKVSQVCKEHKVIVYIPLSYGDITYAEQVVEYVRNKLPNDSVSIIREFMTYPQYINFLNKIDVALFGHLGQQGMGNITQLLSMGKMVYLNPESESWKYFCSLGLKVFPLASFNLKSVEFCARNVHLSNEIFSQRKSLMLQQTFFES